MPPFPPPSALLRFMRAYMRFSVDDLSAMLKEHELSMPQLGALHVLRAEGPQSVSAIADHIALSRTATSHLVDRLVRKKLVRRQEDPTDRRQKRITLDDAGHDLIAEVHARSDASMDALLEPVSAAKRDALELAMRDVVSELEGVTELESVSAQEPE